jgi:phenylalanyl-tRNA synthetase beta chain
VVLESANFQASSSVRKTSVAIKLRTDASMRYEKAQDPANTVRGLARAIELLREISPGIRLVGGVADQKKPSRAAGHRTAAARLAGAQARPRGGTRRGARHPGTAGIRRGRAEPGVFSVTVPGWRATKDVAIKDDLVEEVGRMVGYDSISRARPPCSPPCRPRMLSAPSTAECAPSSPTKASPKSTTTRS